MLTPRRSGKPLEVERPEVDPAYALLMRTFEADPRVTVPAGSGGKFGSNGLRVDGKIFAMSVGGDLAVKLPARDVDEAVTCGRGERLAMGGRVMKEWLVVHEPVRQGPALARRARAFVAGEG